MEAGETAKKRRPELERELQDLVREFRLVEKAHLERRGAIEGELAQAERDQVAGSCAANDLWRTSVDPVVQLASEKLKARRMPLVHRQSQLRTALSTQPGSAIHDLQLLKKKAAEIEERQVRCSRERNTPGLERAVRESKANRREIAETEAMIERMRHQTREVDAELAETDVELAELYQRKLEP